MRSPVAVDAPSVWTPHDFPNEASWSFDLSPDDQHAVIAYAQGGPPLRGRSGTVG